ncbi:MAG: hypothetical protein ACM3X3_04990 [Betaproteobacteria bacterium]
MPVVTVFYYALVGYMAVLVIWNLIKTKNLEEAALYAIVALPLILRILRIK